MKSTVVDESLSSSKTNVLFQRISAYFNIEVHVLSSAIEQVYNTFFYTSSMHLLHQQSEEVLFGHFVTMLNAAFLSKLALEDEGYESGSENFNIPTPLR